MQDQIESLERRIKSLKQCLPYADGQAYYNDKREIARLQEKLRQLKIIAKSG